MALYWSAHHGRVASCTQCKASAVAGRPLAPCRWNEMPGVTPAAGMGPPKLIPVPPGQSQSCLFGTGQPGGPAHRKGYRGKSAKRAEGEFHAREAEAEAMRAKDKFARMLDREDGCGSGDDDGEYHDARSPDAKRGKSGSREPSPSSRTDVPGAYGDGHDSDGIDAEAYADEW